MLQDYLFLSAISRTTAENGRRIMSLNLLPPSSSSDTSHKGGNMGAGRQTNQQRQREQLLKQLHYRRFRVMVLPDGMARRRANQSQFSPKDKKMHLSVELTLPAHLSKAAVGTQDQPGETARGWMLHKQDSLKSVQDVVLGELQHRSFANKKELLKAKELFNTPGLHTTNNSSSSSSISSKDKTTATPTMWILSTRLLDDTRLPLPARATITDDWVALYAWPAEWSVVVPCYSARLTNESTARYLEWWTRKRKWEEANPELAALQQRNDAAARRSAGSEGGGDGEGDGGAEGKRERGWSRAVEEDQEESTPAAPVAAVEDAGAAVAADGGATGGIVSSSLLSMLSERLGRTSTSSASVQPPSQPHDQPSTTNTSTTAATEASSTAASSESKISAADSASARSVRVHVVSPAGTSLAWLLQTLPEGYSVVEFAELRIVDAASLSNDEVVPLLPERTVQPAKPEGEDEVKVETKAPPTTGTQGSLGGLLAGYASDSDDDEDADNNKGDAEPTQPNVSAGDGPTANADEEPRGSLASLAALHGFTPS